MPEKSDEKRAGKRAGQVPDAGAASNCVLLVGRVSSAPTPRRLPSGDEIVTFRLSVGRSRTAMTARSKVSVDWVDCSAWSARVRRSVARWSVGDRVEVHGALRRRFYAAGAGSATRLEVEVLRARLVSCPADPA